MTQRTKCRRSFLKHLGYGTAAVLSTGLFSSCTASKKRPNILFIFTDDHATGAVSAYGGRLKDVAPTPNIDRIGREGIRFDRCYVTNSVCAPSRATVLTGKHSHLNSVPVNEVRFDITQQTFPRILQQSGYQTALIGKWHLKTEPQGFDHIELMPDAANYYNPDFISGDGLKRVPGYMTDVLTDKALEWISETRGQDKPFLLMLHHMAPHREWLPELRHLDTFNNVTIPEPDNLFDDYSGRGTAARDQAMSIAKDLRVDVDLKMPPDQGDSELFRYVEDRMTPGQLAVWRAKYKDKIDYYKNTNLQGEDLVRWKYQRYMQDYLGCVQAVDENVGRVLKYLDETGMAENTVVVYNADQGFFLGEHGWFDKRFMYEESYRTPLLVRWPGVTAPGSVNKDLVSNLDFAQTFIDIAGAQAPADMQGLSLTPLLQGHTPAEWRTSLYYHYYEFPQPHHAYPHEGVKDARYKLMHFYTLDEWELYDLDKDPHEMHSVYDDPEYAGVVQQMKNELQRLRAQYQLPPLPEKR